MQYFLLTANNIHRVASAKATTTLIAADESHRARMTQKLLSDNTVLKFWQDVSAVSAANKLAGFHGNSGVTSLGGPGTGR